MAETKWPANRRIIGTKVPRLDGPVKATGLARYSYDVNRKGMLFAGTGHGFFYSFDDGAKWTQFRAGLPTAPVTWIVVSKPAHDVVLSTYGRGLFVLRDITALEQSDRFVADAPLQILEPKAGYRSGRAGSADFSVLLRAAPRDTMRVEVLDSAGAKDIVYTPVISGVHGNYLRASLVAAGLDPDNLPPKPEGGYVGSREKRAWRDVWSGGQGVGSIKDIPPAAELCARLRHEYRDAVASL